MNIFKTLLVTTVLLFSSISQAALITDVVDQYEKVNWLESYSYTHDLTEADDDPFTLGSAISGDITLTITDDSKWDWFELVLIQIEEFDFDTGGLSLGSTFIGDVEVNALAAINANGMLDVTVTSLSGDFYVGNSVLNIVTTDVPEPAVVALFGLGLLGLGFARRKTRS